MSRDLPGAVHTVKLRHGAMPPAWGEMIAGYWDERSAEGQSPVALSKRVERLRTLAVRGGIRDPRTATADELDAAITALQLAPSTEQNTRRAVRAFYRWATDTERVAFNPATRLSVQIVDDGQRATRAVRPSGPQREPFPAAWQDDVEAWTAFLIASDSSNGTVHTRLSYLRRFAWWHDGPASTVTTTDLATFIASCAWSTESRRAFRSTARVFFRWAHKHRGHLENPAEDLPSIRPHVPIPRAASDSTVEAALALADARTALMVRLAAFMGLRRAEVAQVHSRDVITDKGELSLVVHGKGRRQRVVPVPDELAPDLRGFTGWLFPSMMGGHLSESTVGDLVGQCLPAGVTMHCLRHRFATKAYGASSDLIATQTLLGHSKPETTRRYVKFDDSGLRGVVDAAATLA